MTAPENASPFRALADASRQLETVVLGYADLAAANDVDPGLALLKIRESALAFQVARRRAEKLEEAGEGRADREWARRENERKLRAVLAEVYDEPPVQARRTA